MYCSYQVAKKGEPKPAAARRRGSKADPKHPTRNRRIVQLLVLFVASVIVVDGLVGERGLLAMLRARREYDELSAIISRQRAENARLRDQARRLLEQPTSSNYQQELKDLDLTAIRVTPEALVLVVDFKLIVK